jgi:hypothetical protein
MPPPGSLQLRHSSSECARLVRGRRAGAVRYGQFVVRHGLPGAPPDSRAYRGDRSAAYAAWTSQPRYISASPPCDALPGGCRRRCTGLRARLRSRSVDTPSSSRRRTRRSRLRGALRPNVRLYGPNNNRAPRTRDGLGDEVAQSVPVAAGAGVAAVSWRSSLRCGVALPRTACGVTDLASIAACADPGR